MTPRLFMLTALAAALAACSSVPQQNASLDQARMRFTGLQSEPQVTQYAADEVGRAGTALQAA